MNENSGFLSPIQLFGPYINSSTFHVTPENPTGELVLDVSLDIPHDPKLQHEDGLYSLRHEMSLVFTLTEKEGKPIERMRAELAMGGAVAVADNLALEAEEVLAALQLNAVSLFYAAARSHIEMLSSQSPMGRFTVPPIDPQAYINSISAT